MKKKTILTILVFTSLNTFCQKIDTLPSTGTFIEKLAPIYFEAIKSGIFDEAKDTSWNSLQTHESPAYNIKVPQTWLKLGSLGTAIDEAFDASELYFRDSFNSKPVLVGVFILNQHAASLEDAKTKCLNGYRTNPDRVFEPGYSDTVTKTKLLSGQNAYIARTRFYRKSTQLNQSRYDLIVFSDITKQGYLIMVSIQYSDSTYNFENSNNLLEFANRVYSNFFLK